MKLDQISTLLEIAGKALEADRLEREAKWAKLNLNEAYEGFKKDNGLDRIEADSPEWKRMMFATRIDYHLSQNAKRQAYNAKRRLQSVIARYHREGGAA